MAGHRNPTIGYLPCPHCDYQCGLSETSTGKVSLACQGCGMSAYAAPGSDAHADWRRAMKPKRAAAPEPSPAPSPEPVPDPPKAKGGFSLSDM